MDIITLVLGLSAIVTFFIWMRRHDPSLPPCPVTAVPILGHLPYLGGNPRSTFKKWRKQCGDIYSLYMGQTLVVVLNGYDLLKEALITNEELFSDRPYVLFDAAICGKSGTGLAFSNGDVWREQRAVTITNFRRLGVGKNLIAEKIYEIAAINNEHIAHQNGHPTHLEEILTTNTANVTCSIIFGRCFDHNDEVFVKALGCFKEIVADADARNLANYFPFLVNLPGDLFKLNKIKENGSYIVNCFLKENIQKCISNSIDEHHLDNYIAMYIAQRDKKLKDGQNTSLNLENLTKSVYDMFGAGLDTTSVTLNWCILYFLHYPVAQEKVFREIEQEVGLHRPPNMDDKNQLPYLNAFIQETQRLASIIPLNVMHMCSKTTTLRGYTIPKGTQILSNLDSVLHDKKIWGEDANTFRPERFLDGSGKVKCPEEFVPFSLGRRICPGAALSKMQLFIFLSRMIQRFKFLPSEPGRLPSIAPQFGLVVCPAKFHVRAIERNL